jgi:hypothetical protein
MYVFYTNNSHVNGLSFSRKISKTKKSGWDFNLNGLNKILTEKNVLPLTSNYCFNAYRLL